ncbi:MAG: alpha/beta hydrolase [Alcanivoracaceae bacterium]|nr:alpha/beta hydrolase [Alcanivoracaceae bacterium]
MAAQREHLSLSGPAGVIEAVMEYSSEQPRFIGVVCHPHPLFGGAMENKVVTSLCRAVRDAGGVALRFNFRGVGKSQGVHGAGFTESEDLLAVIGWLKQRWPDRPVWLAGFSFGSWVAVRGAASLASAGGPLTHLLLLAPPVHHNDFDTIEHTGCPVTVVVGEQDEVVPVAEMLAWANDTALNPDLVRFPVSGHFFHGQLVELAEVARQTFP